MGNVVTNQQTTPLGDARSASYSPRNATIPDGNSYQHCARDFRITSSDSFEKIARVIERLDDRRRVYDDGECIVELEEDNVQVCEIRDVAIDALTVYAFEHDSHQNSVVVHLEDIRAKLGYQACANTRSLLMLLGVITVFNPNAQRISQDTVRDILCYVEEIIGDHKLSYNNVSNIAVALSTMCIVLDSSALNQQAARDNDVINRLHGVRVGVDAYFNALCAAYGEKNLINVSTMVHGKLGLVNGQIQCAINMLMALLDVSDVPSAPCPAVVVLRVTQEAGIETIERVVCTPELLTRPFEGCVGGLDHSKWLESIGAVVLPVGDSYPTTRAQLLWAVNHTALGYAKFLVGKGSDPSKIEQTNGDCLLSINMPHRTTAAVMVKYLVERGASIDLVQQAESKNLPLHAACKWRNEDLVGFLIRSGANLHAKDSNGDTPLSILMQRPRFRTKTELLERKIRQWTYQIAYRLCELGATWDREFVDRQMKSALGNDWILEQFKDWVRWFGALAECIDIWVVEHKAGSPLSNFNIIYDANGFCEKVLRKHHLQMQRLTVCVVGERGSGKTSLLQSVWWGKQALTSSSESAVGIHATTMSFSTARRSGSPDTRDYNICCFDYSGEDSYQLAHAPFFSDGTPYFLCIDAERLVAQWKEVSTLSANAKHEAMSCYVTRGMCSWIRVILMGQPAAEIKLVFTKGDKVSTEEINATLSDLSIYLDEWQKNWLKELKGAVSIATAAFETLKKSLQGLVQSVSPRVVVSSATDTSAESARQLFIAFVMKQAEWTELSATYSAVWDVVNKMRQAPVCELVVSAPALKSSVRQSLPSISSDDYQHVLYFLQDQGLVAVHDTFIVLDPTLIHKLVDEVVSDKHAHAVGDATDSLCQTGVLKHSRLVTFPTWSQFKEEPATLSFFKRLMQSRGLAYPVNDDNRMIPKSDLIVPTFWNTVTLDTTTPDQGWHDVASWIYELSSNMSALVFKELAACCRMPSAKNCVSTHSFRAFVADEFETSVVWKTTDGCMDVITIQVAAKDATKCKAVAPFFLRRMDEVLARYPRIKVNCLVRSPRGTFTRAEDFRRMQSEARVTGNDVPSIAGFTSSGLRNQVSALEPVVEAIATMQHELRQGQHVLATLMVTSDSRRMFPALFTIQYFRQENELTLRFYSDLTGECRHAGIVVPVPSDFIQRHANWIRVGISLFSLVQAELLPNSIVQAITNTAVGSLSSRIDHAERIYNVTSQFVGDQYQSDPCNPEEAKALLEELLGPEDLSSRISQESNLVLAAQRSTGQYLWVHRSELSQPDSELQACSPPTPQVRLVPIQVQFVLQIKSAIGVSSPWSKTYYCAWSVQEEDTTSPLARGETSRVRNAPVWTDSFPLHGITSLDQLRKTKLRVVFNRLSRLSLANDQPLKELAKGQVDLSDKLNQELPVEIEVPVTPTQSNTVEKVLVTIMEAPQAPPSPP